MDLNRDRERETERERDRDHSPETSTWNLASFVIAGDRMSKGLRQKEKLRLGEVPRWASVGPGAVMGGLGPW